MPEACRTAWLFSFVLLAACYNPKVYQAPVPLTDPRRPAEVHASFERAWRGAIDAFAEANIAIETLDKASGLLVPRDVVYVGALADSATKYADCGTLYPEEPRYLRRLRPSSARFNVVVRGDSSRSDVLVRAFFQTVGQTYSGPCVSRGVFEQMMESAIATRASAERR